MPMPNLPWMMNNYGGTTFQQPGGGRVTFPGGSGAAAGMALNNMPAGSGGLGMPGPNSPIMGMPSGGGPMGGPPQGGPPQGGPPQGGGQQPMPQFSHVPSGPSPGGSPVSSYWGAREALMKAQMTGDPMQIAMAQMALERAGQMYNMYNQRMNQGISQRAGGGGGGIGDIAGYLMGMGG